MMFLRLCSVMFSVPRHHLLCETIWDHLGYLARRQPRSRCCRPAGGRRGDACAGRLQGLSPLADVPGLADLPWVPHVMPSMRLGPRYRRGSRARECLKRFHERTPPRTASAAIVSSASPARARPSSDSGRVLSYNRVLERAAQPYVVHLPDRVLNAYEAELTNGYRHSARSHHRGLFDHH